MSTPLFDDAPLALDAAGFPLWGSRLIEASAGAGIPWTIAALYVRLVLGHGGPNAFAQPRTPADILVMTFTRAATRELSDRIRERLLEAAGVFRGESLPQANDTLMRTLLAAYPEGEARQSAAWRLANAAESMDDAAVLTIDAWCQRMLREHAFDSGNLFDETLLADETLLQTQAALDYWRLACYPLAPDELRAVLRVWKNAAELVADMRDLSHKVLEEVPAGWTMQQLLAHVTQ